MSYVKSITCVFTISYALHPLSNERVTLWVSDYVLAGYGTGAVMAVPSGDQRAYNFAKFFNIPIKNIFFDKDISEGSFQNKDGFVLTHSSFLDGLNFNTGLSLAIKNFT